MSDDKKINIDDITFEDMLGEGVEVAEVEESAEELDKVETKDEDVKETNTEDAESSLDADAEAKVVEDEEETKKESRPVESKKKERVETPGDETENVEGEKEDESIVGQVLNTLGYSVESEYDDTTEGLVSLTKDVGAQMAEEHLDELFKKHPLVGQHLSYVLNGGKSQDFMTAHDPKTDFSNVTLKDDDLNSQKYVLSEYFKMKGHDDKFISELLEDYEDTGKLKSKAEMAQKSLASAQKKYRADMLKRQEAEQKQYYAEQKKFWDGVYNTIDESKEFKGIAIPDREKSKFFDYLSKPVTKEGYTQRDLDHNEADVDVKLAIDYLMYKGFNLDKIIDKKARTKSVRTLKDKIKGHQETVKSARKTTKTSSKKVDIDDLNLNLF